MVVIERESKRNVVFVLVGWDGGGLVLVGEHVWNEC